MTYSFEAVTRRAGYAACIQLTAGVDAGGFFAFGV